MMQLRCSVGEASELFITGSNVDQCFRKNKVTVYEKIEEWYITCFPAILKPSIFDPV